MLVTLVEDAPSCIMVKKWAAEFNCGRKSLEEDLCPIRLVTAATQETIAMIHDIIMADR